MPFETFDIFFSGKLLPNADAKEARRRVGKIFNASDRHIEKLFSGKKVKVKSGVDVETAGKYREAFRKSGAVIDIQTARPKQKPAVIEPPVEETPATEVVEEINITASEGLQLVPINTGSLAEFGTKEQPIEIPHTIAMTMDAPGEIIDETEPPPAININTSKLSIAAANSGSLKEFQTEKPAVEIADISHLKFR